MDRGTGGNLLAKTHQNGPIVAIEKTISIKCLCRNPDGVRGICEPRYFSLSNTEDFMDASTEIFGYPNGARGEMLNAEIDRPRRFFCQHFF